MLPPPLELIRIETLKRFAEIVGADHDCSLLPNLLDTELLMQLFSRTLGNDMVQVFVNVRLQQAQHNKLLCPGCDQPMEWLRKSQWQRGTPLGPVSITDVFAYCRTCHDSARPLHGYLGTDRERWSLGVEEAAVDLATDESCERAADKLARHHPGVEVGRTTVLRMMHKHGALGRDFIQHKLDAALASVSNEGRSTGGVAELEVEHDGGMIPVAKLEPLPTEPDCAPQLTAVRGLPKRRKNTFWQEVKVGLVQVPGEVEGRLYSVRPTNELNAAFDDLLALACLKGWTEQTEVRGIADGARHIRDRMHDTFNGCAFRFILDRPHAREHLSEAGAALSPLNGIDAQSWATDAMNRLENGQVMSVVTELQNAYEQAANTVVVDDTDDTHDDLRLNANYFERNKESVAYAEYRERGWSTASSEVESANRHVVQLRLKIPGAWWLPDNVPNILALRMLKANGWWDEYWSHQRDRWRARACEFRHPT
jgi:hypothetical protein